MLNLSIKNVPAEAVTALSKMAQTANLTQANMLRLILQDALNRAGYAVTIPQAAGIGKAEISPAVKQRRAKQGGLAKAAKAKSRVK